eukprot:m.37757 g.37757  ORF g.37757 m.37757 type:complete len:535 (+) comp6758_c0_seq1:352-1956(+)
MSSKVNTVLAAIRKQRTSDVTSPKDRDLAFLDNLLKNKDFKTLLNLHSQLNEITRRGLLPTCNDSEARAKKLFNSLGNLSGEQEQVAHRVREFLTTPSLRAILRSHDLIAQEDLKEGVDAGQMKGVMKEQIVFDTEEIGWRVAFKAMGEPLGCALRAELDDSCGTRILITRVFVNSLAHRSGTMFSGDEIVSVNGTATRGLSTQEVSVLIKQDPIRLELEIVSNKDGRAPKRTQMYVRALFNYDAPQDTWIPCENGGLSFSKGDIIEVVAQDGDWWEAHLYGDDAKNLGLIPSEKMQTKRMEAQAFNFGLNPLITPVPYERVTLVQPTPNFCRPIILLGADGVGRRTIKGMLTSSYPQVFASPVTHTSCFQYSRSVNPDFVYVGKPQMQQDIKRGLYIEHGKHDGDLYGIYKNDVLELARQGKTCILDAQAKVVELVRTPEVQAYIIMIMPPNLRDLRTTRQDVLSENDMRELMISADQLFHSYGSLCDKKIINNDLQACVDDIIETVRILHTSPQWVPSSWGKRRLSTHDIDT